MANIQERLDQAVTVAETASQKLHQTVNGGETETVTVESGEIPTVAKAIKDIRDSISSGASDIIQIATDAKNAAVQAKNDILNNSGFIAVSSDLTGENTIGVVAEHISEVGVVASISDAVSKTANVDGAVTTISQNIPNITIVAQNIDDIKSSGTNINQIKIVAENKNDINTVSSNISNIKKVADNEENIDILAVIADEISDVSAISTSVSAVAKIEDNIGTVVTNLEAVQNAAQNAVKAEQSAQAALESEKAAALSAEQAAASANLSDATESVKGIIQLATESEALSGANTVKAITPQTLKSVNDSQNSAIANTYATQSNVSSHTGNKNNPHGVTKAQIGLGNCDNTSDINKPISTATQNALNAKAPLNIPVNVISTKSGTISLADNSINRIAPTGTVTFSLPSVSNHNIFHQILVQITLSSVITINLGTSVYFGGEKPTFETGKYNIVYEHNGTSWTVGAVKTA